MIFLIMLLFLLLLLVLLEINLWLGKWKALKIPFLFVTDKFTYSFFNELKLNI